MANYLFDTLYHDIFQVDEEGLKEGLISVGSKNPEEPDPLEPSIIGRLDNRYKCMPCDTRYYTNEGGDEAVMRRILNWYILLSRVVFALHNLQEETSLKCSTFLLDETTFATNPSENEDGAWLGDIINRTDMERASSTRTLHKLSTTALINSVY